MQHFILRVKLAALLLVKGLVHLIEFLWPFVAAALIIFVGLFLWQKAVKLIRSESRKCKTSGVLIFAIAFLYTIGSLFFLFLLLLVIMGYPEAVRD